MTALLYLAVVPYLALMLLVIGGLLKPYRRPYSPRTPPVSVVVPAHNEVATLDDTLASLAAQRYDGALEFIIVDDRSSDGTAALVETWVRRDTRFRLVRVEQPHPHLSPKVNAVRVGIAQATGEIILTTDADCRHHPDWAADMVSHFEDDVVMVVGHVETTRPDDGSSLLQRLESTDWLSLLLTSYALLQHGFAFAGSANNQAYRRSAFDAAGGFGAAGCAPSGDEDLLMQRLGRYGRVVFALKPTTRVLTRPMPNLAALIRQRQRWVSRYRYARFYSPAFLAGIYTLGFQSLVLSLAVLLSPLFPTLLPHVALLWAVKLAIEYTGMYLATRRFDRRDLWGWPVVMWALAHPFFIALVVMLALVRPSEWRAELPAAPVTARRSAAGAGAAGSTPTPPRSRLP